MTEVTKNEYFMKDKLQLLDELILKMEEMERQAKTNFVMTKDVTDKLEAGVAMLSDRMTWF